MAKKFKKGDKVTTVFGEKLEVLDTRTIPAKSKKGKVVEEGRTDVLAQSGDHKVWFPETNLKEKK